ncbi:MAG: TonB-dependent receptor [Kordiimonadaceae bacterium]|nr:TonB-dependent receptor [Kordiimonadaceae bacterium]
MIDHKIYKGAKKLGLVSALALTVSWAAHADVKAADARTFEFDVVSMPLNEALIQFSVQSEWQFLSSQKVLKGKTAKAVSGSMSREEALHQLLGGTGLAYAVDGKGQVRIVPHNAKSNAQSNAQSNARGGKAKSGDMSKRATFQYASAEAINTIGTDATTGSGGADGAEGNDDEKDKGTFFGKLSEDDLEEIVITGSHIRGARSASPVFLYGRQDIEQTGVSTVPQFIQTLPQNFGGGISENGGAGNVNGGSGINLRGLGNDSTLVLLNGRRLAPAGVGNFVDISMIPLSAIERIEVLTDGASAIYGSDAVGGVVNFRLRDDMMALKPACATAVRHRGI